MTHGFKRVGIVGLGYVGLPLAVAFGESLTTIGFDIDPTRVEQLKKHNDTTDEVGQDALRQAKHLTFTDNSESLTDCDVIIITVPTPVYANKQPDFTPLKGACETVGQIIKTGCTVIFESTVFPGATEEICIPVIEEVSSLNYNRDFFAGYSPERINPGDKQRQLKNIVKVTSGSNEEIANRIDLLYQSIIDAGTHKASSIKVAEASKVIENTQRDLNIALINEFAIIFEKIGIDTQEVLNAAGTKWNFLPFKPGLVGGHCIGIDPYYLVHKSETVGHHPDVILAGRRINDKMGEYVVDRIVKSMVKHDIHVSRAKVLIMGITFKENCHDIRNSKVIDIVSGLNEYSIEPDVYDPWAKADEVKQAYDVTLSDTLKENYYDFILLAVAHQHFQKLGIKNIRKLGKSGSVVFDLKYMFPASDTDERL